MFDKIRTRLFPCDRIVQDLMSEHSLAVRENQIAHNTLRVACGEGVCLQGRFHAKIGVHDDQIVKL